MCIRDSDPSDLLDIYREVDALPGMKKSFIGSGVRYDMLLHESNDRKINNANPCLLYTSRCV